MSRVKDKILADWVISTELAKLHTSKGDGDPYSSSENIESQHSEQVPEINSSRSSAEMSGIAFWINSPDCQALYCDRGTVTSEVLQQKGQGTTIVVFSIILLYYYYRHCQGGT